MRIDPHWALAAYAIFFAPFAVRGLINVVTPRRDVAGARAAPFSRSLVALSTLGFFLQILALWDVVSFADYPRRFLFEGQTGVGIALAALGWLLALWALLTFRSWRTRAKLAANHALKTDGPFALVRHPIYAAIGLFTLGIAIWLPTPLTVAGFVVTAAVSDARARAEERILLEAYGDAYRSYAARVKRFIPFVY